MVVAAFIAVFEIHVHFTWVLLLFVFYKHLFQLSPTGFIHHDSDDPPPLIGTERAVQDARSVSATLIPTPHF